MRMMMMIRSMLNFWFFLFLENVTATTLPGGRTGNRIRVPLCFVGTSKQQEQEQQQQQQQQQQIINLLAILRGGEDTSNLGKYQFEEDEDGPSDDDEDNDDGDDDEEHYDDSDDIDEADDDDAAAVHKQRRDLRRNPGAPNPFDDMDEDKYSNMNNPENINRMNDGRRQQRRPATAPYIPRQKKKKKTKSKNVLTKLAKTSFDLSKKAAFTTVQTSGKAAYHLMRPKSIEESEIWGIWRLDQQVGIKQSIANIELTKRGDVIIRGGDGGGEIIWKSPFRFVKPTWPQSCRIEFEARAFQPSSSDSNSNRHPWLLFYKGYLERKVADPSVIKMVGRLYEIERPKGLFGKDLPVRYNKIGSFVGRRRVVLLDEEQEEDYNSDNRESDFNEDDHEYNSDDQQDDDGYDYDSDGEEL